MLIKILGSLDILTALAFILNNNFDKSNSWFPNGLVLALGIYLLIKGLMFLLALDWMSLLDTGCAIIILVSLSIHIHPAITFIISLFLLQKGIFSIIQ